MAFVIFNAAISRDQELELVTGAFALWVIDFSVLSSVFFALKLF